MARDLVTTPTMAARPLSTKASNVPDTAVIIEFSCLYTHDVVRKKKRWQDGRLRFHTFNKRIMVYDDAMNYIDGQHRRTDETMNEGDDIQLDGGVLVQVEQQQRTVRQDLTELRKPRRSQGSPKATEDPMKPTYRESLNVQGSGNCTPLMLKPKSIEEVLKKSKTSRSRSKATIALSPFDQLRCGQLLDPGTCNPRPSKVRKTASRPATSCQVALAPLQAERSRQGVHKERIPNPITATNADDVDTMCAAESSDFPSGERRKSETPRAGRANPKQSQAQSQEPVAPGRQRRQASPCHDSRLRGTSPLDSGESPLPKRLKGKLQLGGSKRHKLVCGNETRGGRMVSGRAHVKSSELRSELTNEIPPPSDPTPVIYLSDDAELGSSSSIEPESNSQGRDPTNLPLLKTTNNRSPLAGGSATLRPEETIRRECFETRLADDVGQGGGEEQSTPSLYSPLAHCIEGDGQVLSLQQLKRALSLQRPASRELHPGAGLQVSNPSLHGSNLADDSRSSSHSVAEPRDDEDTGPWTREAFDLFG